MKYSVVLLISLLSSFALAKEQTVPVNQEALKTIGDKLANYEQCQVLAESEGDAVMAYYYQDIKQTTLAENTAYSEAELAYINSEYKKGALLLSHLNSAGLFQLCLNRFDPVSRQYYEAKLKAIKD
ncbi:hypothetical protein DS885_14580 [Psychromonas sp. B3M02]|uniref:hypothetical protein n=1 Tax=unclassified Psychromonas TaxID=2614957 RepID=UPI000DEB6CF0|nr:hypothetical protein [Psychromonas sp. B3M02]RBW42751.1 hypothetical protein DS885_14580 [Psychromonas sp. B3M02]